jgi:hypothetical protein
MVSMIQDGYSSQYTDECGDGNTVLHCFLWLVLRINDMRVEQVRRG